MELFHIGGISLHPQAAREDSANGTEGSDVLLQESERWISYTQSHLSAPFHVDKGVDLQAANGCRLQSHCDQLSQAPSDLNLSKNSSKV